MGVCYIILYMFVFEIVYEREGKKGGWLTDFSSDMRNGLEENDSAIQNKEPNCGRGSSNKKDMHD